ncbi:GlcG/HbpS family heme-binding protein [Bailinhaonella thermotolerans]|uniref:Heme-binding protein n=1 Tax=Bailinhaonella thermotolerans TaxID=1070861 RepID=A0A3A4ASD4_9ACTN|nr:heme-binding protein [Bailinhaonella thermotolerans]RJL32808.1 heme-binding protein [Bailinhaonella thermotolerans]
MKKTTITRGVLATSGLALVLGSIGISAAQAAPAAAPAKAAPAKTTPAKAAPAGGGAVAQTRVLSADALLRIGDAALKEAGKRGQRVTIAVVDRSGVTRLILKTENAGPQTEESARRKAFTAAGFGQPTSRLAGGAGGEGVTIRDIPGTLFLAGGVPVASGGAPIAGIGVGGAPQGSIDEAIAQAGLRAVEGGLN